MLQPRPSSSSWDRRCLGSTKALEPFSPPSPAPSGELNGDSLLWWSSIWEEAAARSCQHLQIIHQLHAQTRGARPHASGTGMWVLGSVWICEFRRLGGRRIKHKRVVFVLSTSRYPSPVFPSASNNLPYFPCSCRRERGPTENSEPKIYSFAKYQEKKKHPKNQKLPLPTPSMLKFLFFPFCRSLCMKAKDSPTTSSFDYDGGAAEGRP